MKTVGNVTSRMVWEIYHKVFTKYWRDDIKYSFIYEKYNYNLSSDSKNGTITFYHHFSNNLNQKQLNSLYKDLLKLLDENNK